MSTHRVSMGRTGSALYALDLAERSPYSLALVGGPPLAYTLVGSTQKNALPRSTSRAYSVCWIVSRTWSVTLNNSIGSSAASGS